MNRKKKWKTPRNGGVPARTPSLRLKMRSEGVASAEIRSDGGGDDDSNAFDVCDADLWLLKENFSSLKFAKKRLIFQRIAQSMDIPFSVNEIIQTPMEEFNDLLTRLVRWRLTQALIMITTTVTNNDEHHEKSTFEPKLSGTSFQRSRSTCVEI